MRTREEIEERIQVLLEQAQDLSDRELYMIATAKRGGADLLQWVLEE